jgi:thiol-disulfide isomerase/thioredoxin
MKRTVFILTTLFCLQLTFSQTINHVVTDAKGKEKLLGLVNKERLTQAPFNDWFSKNYDAYIVNKKLVKTLKDSLQQYTIKVFLGTWCGDSKKEVPRFYKALETVGFPENQLEVIAVDKTAEAYKQSPNGEEKGLNIHRVPTFIFYKNGQEVNRIVEHPKATFEHDFEAIINGTYRPHYLAANYVHGLIATNSLDSLKTMENTLVPQLSEFVKGSRELNTLGYVNLRANKLEEALYIFDLNTKIFPYKYNVYDSLAEAYYESKNYTEALKNYYKVLSLKPEDENAKEMVEKINKITPSQL